MLYNILYNIYIYVCISLSPPSAVPALALLHSIAPLRGRIASLLRNAAHIYLYIYIYIYIYMLYTGGNSSSRVGRRVAGSKTAKEHLPNPV